MLARFDVSRAEPGTAERRVLLVAMGVAVAGWVAALVFMSSVPLSGDETFYADNARVIADLLTGRGGSYEAVKREVVARGWFMPGMSLFMVPLHAVDPEPAVPVVRAYAAAVYFLLWLWTLKEISAAFGRYAAIGLLLFPTLAAMWLVFAATLWGDLPAGLLLAVVTARTYRMAVSIVEQRGFRIRDVITLEVIMVAMVYLRGNTIVAVAAAHVFLLVLALVSREWSQLLPRAGALAVGIVVFAALLAPWSLTASRVLGGTVVTTSSAPLSLAITFGDRDRICFGPCKGPGLFYWGVRYSRQYAKQEGISELEAQRQMASYALGDLTLRSYARQARSNFRSFVTPTGNGPGGGLPFIERFTKISTRDISPAAARTVHGVVAALTLALYVPFFAALIVANVAVFVRWRRRQILSLCVKLFTISLFLQPFFHESHSRYWVAFAPLMSISAFLLLDRWLGRRGLGPSDAGVAGAGAPNAGGRTLVGLQAGYVVLIAATAAMLWLA